MKKLFLLLVGLLFIGFALAQEFPKGSWQMEPSHPEFKEDTGGPGHWEVSRIKVVWDDDSNLFADYPTEGVVTNMTFRSRENVVFSFPLEENGKEKIFTPLEQWRKFAEQARARCRFLTEHTYVDTVPYEFVGKSRVLRGLEFGRDQEHLVFKDGDRLVVVSLWDWEGTEPKKGEKLLLGRHRVLNVFFRVEKVGEKFLIEPRTSEILAELVRRKEEALAEPKEAPVPTLPTIVVEGRLPDKEK